MRQYKEVRLSVDPGLSGTGWALWGDGRLRLAGIYYARASQRVRKVAPWELRAMTIADQLMSLATTKCVQSIVIEYPSYFESSMGQMVARSGDLLKLTTLVGIIAGRAWPTPVVLVPVNTWKGQLPKEVVEKRLRNVMGDRMDKLRVRSHAIDAVGIGLWSLGRF